MSFIKSIGEYLNIVRNGLANGDKIIQAMVIGAQIKNGTINAEALAEILKRREICASCEFNSDNAKKEGFYSSALPYTHCIMCTCKLGADDSKESCLKCECGISIWNEQHPDQKMEVKWFPFEIKEK